MNYCRRIDTSKGSVIFFDQVPPFQPEHYHDYAFWALPADTSLRTFQGHLIGESSDLRAQRMGSNPTPRSYRKNTLI